MKYCSFGFDDCIYGKGIKLQADLTFCTDCRSIWFMDNRANDICSCILGCKCKENDVK